MMQYKELTITVLETLDSLLQKRDIHRALRILMAFREVLELETIPAVPEQAEVGLGLALGQVIEDLRPVAAEKEVMLMAFVPPTALVVCGTWDHTLRAWTAILRSLLYAVPVGSRIFLQVQEAADGITIAIQSNDALGAVRKIRQAMEGFDSLGGHSDPHGDVVLDLFLARVLVERHGGTISLAGGASRDDILMITLPQLAAVPAGRSPETVMRPG